MTGELQSQQEDLLQVNRQLDHRNRFIEAVLGGVSAGVIGLDKAGEITLPNRSACALLSVEPDQLRGRKLAEAVPEMAELLVEARRRPRRRSERTIVLAGVDGTARHLLVRIAAELDRKKIIGFVVTFDADGQHCVEDIAAMVEPILRGTCEITLGSRFLGTSENVPPSRKLTLRLAVLFTRIFSGVKLTDAHNGLRAFSRAAAGKIQIKLDRMAHASELIDQIKRSGLPFTEVPVRIRYTEYSLGKGQTARGALQIVVQYLLGKVLQ